MFNVEIDVSEENTRNTSKNILNIRGNLEEKKQNGSIKTNDWKIIMAVDTCLIPHTFTLVALNSKEFSLEHYIPFE